MKTLNLLLVILIAGMATAMAQETKSRKPRTYKVYLTDKEGITYRGIIHSLGEDKIGFSPLKAPKNSSLAAAQEINFENIDYLKVQRKGSAGRGALWGALIGIGTGVVIGLVSGDDEVMPYYTASQDPTGLGNLGVGLNNMFAMTAGEKALAYGLGMGTMGAITGAIIGAVAKKKFIIGGQKEPYNTMRATVLEMTYGKRSTN